MNVENLPKIKPKDYGDVQDQRWPILSLDFSMQGPHRLSPHAHPRGQIIYPASGTYWVVTPLSSWVLPARQALWIPPFVHHDVFSNDAVNAYVFFIDESYTESLPSECLVMNVSNFLREIFIRVIENKNFYAENGPELRLVQCMLDEINQMTTASLSLPMATDKRLLRLMLLLLENPSDDRNFDQLAENSGASIRTLARLFKNEVGLSFSDWRKQLRLLHSIERLQQGHSVKNIAIDLGYSSSSAFIAMFHQALGAPPGQYASEGFASL